MAEYESEEFQAGVSAGSDDRDFGISRHVGEVVLRGSRMGKRESHGVELEFLCLNLRNSRSTSVESLNEISSSFSSPDWSDLLFEGLGIVRGGG